MKAKFEVRFVLEAKTEKAQAKVRNRILTHMRDTFGLTLIEESPFYFTADIDVATWPLAVYTALEISQSLGRSWIITDKIQFALSGWTSTTHLVGVSGIDVGITNPEVDQTNSH